MQLTQINLQPYFGGGEVYTAFLSRALAALGVKTRLLAHPQATFWKTLDLPETIQIERVPEARRLPDWIGAEDHWLLSHGPMPASLLAVDKPADCLITAIAHMPVQGRNPSVFSGHRMVFPVSAWVKDGLLAAGIPTWPQPLYGLANLDPLVAKKDQPIFKTSRYDWDRRKFRDRIGKSLEPLMAPFLPRREMHRRPGLTLGIVSRLTPIKQFPRLFSILAPILARHPQINLEIFGSGGYASVRDLSRSLQPMDKQARFWGHQQNVYAVYVQLDYLMSGLPEKEALGLNIIEAQACNLPVLAPLAPPFTETIAEGLTGHFYRDPRQDDGMDFSRLIDELLHADTRIQPALAQDHLRKFSFEAFVERLRPVVRWAKDAQ
ncbi:MAG TPA: glycosyltransferase [Accumulibacter sp.]|nr:glycosyltransferase [Accumulibacter sp.]HMW17546.1 glycosyltransferase [Accumulibacter sp.]HMX22409.1 glycosyltransferase [Accumulibacter sp.]HMY06000.1 glycosyltransferase [Accumulibacter sp.]HNC17624.1 glycosyltransferase [Accumulibacter sp.]